VAAAGNVATDDDYRFLEGQGPAANVQIQEQPRPRKTGAPPPVLPQPTPADSAAGDADYAFLEGKTPPVPTAPTAPAPVAPGTTSFPAGNLTPRQMKEQLDREGLWVQNENANVQAYQKAIVGKPISPEQWQDYQQRVAELQRRSTAWQGLNAQYQGLPAATVPPIRPVQYHVTPEEQKLDAIEPALAKRGHAPSSPPVIARLKQQYGIGQAALAGTFAPRKAQLDADGARLAAEDKTLAEIGEKLQAGELPPSTEAPYMAALRQHQMNVAAYRGTAEVFNNQVNRYSAFLKKYQNEDLHLGMVYPEEVGTAPGPSASQRAFQAVSGFFQPISAAAERNLPKVRRAMMFAGQYPDLPELPRNLPPDQKQALIRQKNDLLTLVERDTRGGPLELDPLTGAMRPRTAHLNIAALTPFQKQILPIVQQQFAAEKKARELAGVENAGYIDAAAMAASLLVGGAVSKAVAGKLAGRFAPFLFDSVAAPALTSNSALFRQLLVQRVIPQVLASTAGFTVGGAAGGFTAGALLAPGKNGKPPSLTERAAFGGEAAARSAIPSAVTGIVWGTAAAIAGTVVPTFLKSRWNPETGPVANEAFTQEAVGRAKAAGVEMTPEEVGRFSRRFRVIQRSPQLAKPALWRELAGDWNSFISRRLPGEVPPPDVAGGTPATGSLGPAPAELGPAPFGGEPVPGPTITTPAGLAWDLRWKGCTVS
jgi:hypothetical protein